MHYITVMQMDGTQHMAVRIVGSFSVIYIVSNIKTLCEICTMQTSSCCEAPLRHVLAGQVSGRSWIVRLYTRSYVLKCILWHSLHSRYVGFKRIVLLAGVPDMFNCSIVDIIRLIDTFSTLY